MQKCDSKDLCVLPVFLPLREVGDLMVRQTGLSEGPLGTGVKLEPAEACLRLGGRTAEAGRRCETVPGSRRFGVGGPAPAPVVPQLLFTPFTLSGPKTTPGHLDPCGPGVVHGRDLRTSTLSNVACTGQPQCPLSRGSPSV